MSEFAQIFKMLREERGLTQEKLAQYLNSTKQSISNYENGRRKPDYETLELIADFFNVDIDYLVGRSPIRSKHIIDNEGNIINTFQNDKTEEPVETFPDDILILARGAKTLTKDQVDLVKSLIDKMNKQNED